MSDVASGASYIPDPPTGLDQDKFAAWFALGQRAIDVAIIGYLAAVVLEDDDDSIDAAVRVEAARVYLEHSRRIHMT